MRILKSGVIFTMGSCIHPFVMSKKKCSCPASYKFVTRQATYRCVRICEHCKLNSTHIMYSLYGVHYKPMQHIARVYTIQTVSSFVQACYWPELYIWRSVEYQLYRSRSSETSRMGVLYMEIGSAFSKCLQSI